MAGTLTDAGRGIITNRIKGSGSEPNYIGWGTGTTAESASQTALVTEAAPTTGGGRVAGTSTRENGGVANDTYQVVGTVTATGTAAITEVGLFDAASAGNMLIRALFSAINVVSGDSIQFTIKLRFT